MKKQKRQSVLFRVLDGMAKAIYELRESTLPRWNEYLDQQAGRRYRD